MTNEGEHTLDEYWEAVRGRVCVRCIDSNGAGNCLLTGEHECGLKLHFPKIVGTILAVRSETIEPYIDALRKNVCSGCRHQSPDGSCMFRANLDCGLDRYFPLIIEAIENVRTLSG
jgi:hypothetical protein